MATEIEVLKILKPLTLNFTESNLTPEKQQERLLLYAHELADLPTEILLLAVKKIINEPRTFFPRIGEIREVAIALTEPVYPSALEAWELVTTGNKSCPLATRVFRTLGVDRGDLRYMDFATVSVNKSLFVKEYQARVAQQREEVRMLPAVRELRTQALTYAGESHAEQRPPTVRSGSGPQKLSDLVAGVMPKRDEGVH